MKKTLFVAALGAIMATVAQAQAHDGLHINEPYILSSNPTTAAVFMQIENHKDIECMLEAVTTPLVQRAEIHSHLVWDGMMVMGRMMSPPRIAAGATYQLEQFGDHIMLIGLDQPLSDGDVVKISLDFGECGITDVSVPVDNTRATDSPMHNH